MFFHRLELTTALRPELSEGETILFVQDSVGLYNGKTKIVNQQSGSLYLTTHRICYVDKTDPRKCSVAILLKQIGRWDHTGRFLKSSPKVTIFPKAVRPTEIRGRGPINSALNLSKQTSNWICPICSCPNEIPDSFDPAQASNSKVLRPCKACGIKPPFALVLKAFISDQSQRTEHDHSQQAHSLSSVTQSTVPQPFLLHQTNQCPRCTFVNHPSLVNCEICGTSLPNKQFNTQFHAPGTDATSSDSEGNSSNTDLPECCRISFRTDGDRAFVEILSSAIEQRRWILAYAPSIAEAQQGSRPLGASHLADIDGVKSQPRVGGLAGLEHIDSQRRKANETVIDTAVTDFETLIVSSEQIKALANTFARQNGQGSAQDVLHESALALNVALSKESSSSNQLYLSELSRTLAEYLTDDRHGVLKHRGGIMSLVDLFATFNRAFEGVSVAIPEDFAQAAQLWESNRMSVRLRQFKSGMLAVQRSDWSDDKIIAELLSWLQEIKKSSPRYGAWDWQAFGNGVTAQEVASRFHWSLGVATEELDMAEERGVLCRETCAQGVRYWDNEFLNGSF